MSSRPSALVTVAAAAVAGMCGWKLRALLDGAAPQEPEAAPEEELAEEEVPIVGLFVPADASELAQGLLTNQLAHKVLCSWRMADGDAFLLAVADLYAKPYYLAIWGMRPTDGPPTFSESLRYWQEDSVKSDTEAAERYNNVSFLAYPVPEGMLERKLVREGMVAALEDREREVEAAVNVDADALMDHVSAGWLFASPKRRGARVLADID